MLKMSERVRVAFAPLSEAIEQISRAVLSDDLSEALHCVRDANLLVIDLARVLAEPTGQVILDGLIERARKVWEEQREEVFPEMVESALSVCHLCDRKAIRPVLERSAVELYFDLPVKGRSLRLFARLALSPEVLVGLELLELPDLICERVGQRWRRLLVIPPDELNFGNCYGVTTVALKDEEPSNVQLLVQQPEPVKG